MNRRGALARILGTMAGVAAVRQAATEAGYADILDNITETIEPEPGVVVRFNGPILDFTDQGARDRFAAMLSEVAPSRRLR